MDSLHIAMKYHKGEFCIELTTIALPTILAPFSYIVGNKNSQNILSYAFSKSSFNKIISSLDLLA
jgi:hypothetical protein